MKIKRKTQKKIDDYYVMRYDKKDKDKNFTENKTKLKLLKRGKKGKKEGKFKLTKVISGGQSGSDRCGLVAAKTVGLETGGWAPRGYKTEYGNDITLKNDFNLKEISTDSYYRRTKLNVDNSDGTILFRIHDSPEFNKIIGYCQYGKWIDGEISSKNLEDNVHRPVLIIKSLRNINTVSDIMKWIKHNDIKTLNITGHYDSSSGIENFSQTVFSILVEVFSRIEIEKEK